MMTSVAPKAAAAATMVFTFCFFPTFAITTVHVGLAVAFPSLVLMVSIQALHAHAPTLLTPERGGNSSPIHTSTILMVVMVVSWRAHSE